MHTLTIHLHINTKRSHKNLLLPFTYTYNTHSFSSFTSLTHTHTKQSHIYCTDEQVTVFSCYVTVFPFLFKILIGFAADNSPVIEMKLYNDITMMYLKNVLLPNHIYHYSFSHCLHWTNPLSAQSWSNFIDQEILHCCVLWCIRRFMWKQDNCCTIEMCFICILMKLNIIFMNYV